MSSRSPFPFHGPLPPEAVSGRDVEMQHLAMSLRERRPIALLGPRRYGKTSLIRHTLWRLSDVETNSVVWLDLYGLTSFSDFAVRLDRALSDVRGPFRELLDNVAGGLSVRLGVLGVEVRRSAPNGPDPVAVTHQLLEVLTRAAERHRVIVVLDEFSDVAKVDDLAAILRTHLQHHYSQIGLVFAGSRPSMMRTMFADRGQPFFDQADLLELGPLHDQVVVDIVHSGFNETGRRAGPVAAGVVAIAQGHPQRSMMLADAAWQLTRDGEEADSHTWQAALADVRARVASALEALYDELPGSQGPVMRAVAHTGSPFAAAETRFHDLSSSSITYARDRLLQEGHLVRTPDNGVRIVDPLLADWLRRTFP